MNASEKVAYLKGLMAGLAIDTEKPGNGQIFAAITDALESIVLELEDLSETQTELESGLDAVSDDLADVEDLLYSTDEDDEEDPWDEEENCYAATCPKCERIVYFDEDILDTGEVRCPHCGQELVFDPETVIDSDSGPASD